LLGSLLENMMKDEPKNENKKEEEENNHINPEQPRFAGRKSGILPANYYPSNTRTRRESVPKTNPSTPQIEKKMENSPTKNNFLSPGADLMSLLDSNEKPPLSLDSKTNSRINIVTLSTPFQAASFPSNRNSEFRREARLRDRSKIILEGVDDGESRERRERD